MNRITPAYAGKSSTRLLYVLSEKDHPRLCGEKSVSLADSILITGSPPPMRGKVVRLFNNCECLGITPAYAGKRW